MKSELLTTFAEVYPVEVYFLTIHITFGFLSNFLIYVNLSSKNLSISVY